ncbi:MAG: hypothetical protein FWG20_00545 [Candidatus Cloacimonetes bacterium]|nr:hypothetical protein [Candidatus Cloacimonadota bacterium]
MNDERNDVVENISSTDTVNITPEPVVKKEVPLPPGSEIDTVEKLVEALLEADKQIDEGEYYTWEEVKAHLTKKHGIKW